MNNNTKPRRPGRGWNHARDGAVSDLNFTPIYSGNKIIGQVRGDCLFKVIRASVHLLRRPPAIAISLDALEAAEKAGAVRVQVLDKESGTIYRATIAHIHEAGFKFERGYGLQVGLVLPGWTISRHGEIPAQQLSLWNG